jgi:hypothetical protein
MLTVAWGTTSYPSAFSTQRLENERRGARLWRVLLVTGGLSHMRFWISGPRLFRGLIRPGISFSVRDLKFNKKVVSADGLLWNLAARRWHLKHLR